MTPVADTDCPNCGAPLDLVADDGDDVIPFECSDCGVVGEVAIATIPEPRDCEFCGEEYDDDSPSPFCPTCRPPWHGDAG